MGLVECGRDQQSFARPHSDPYRDALSFYNEPRWQKTSLGLERIRLLLKLLGNPQDSFKTIHVAGTNGKGTICSYLDSILLQTGLRHGLFTSPYIERFEERIRVDGKDMAPDDIVSLTPHIKQCAHQVEEVTGEHPTEFELMCALAFAYFADVGCEVVVCEVGLGGRLDATNVVSPVLCVISRIGLDHTDILGDTLSDIANEKAGIVKYGVPVVSWPQEDAAMDVVRQVCQEKGCDLVVSDLGGLDIKRSSLTDEERRFEYKGFSYMTHMIADYQIEDAAVAIDAATVLSCACLPQIDEALIQRGVQKACWPGRFELLGGDPPFIVDGAHNPQGTEGLAKSLRTLGVDCGYDLTLICGMLADKDCEEALSRILPLASRFVTYTPNSPRALSSKDLAAIAKEVVGKMRLDADVIPEATPEAAIKRALEIVREGALMDSETKKGPEAIVAFGTLYAISDLRKAYAGLKGQSTLS